MKLLAIALLVVACTAVELRVEMNVYSGTPDPVITVRGQEAESILRLLSGQPQETERPIPWFRMGYRGFTVTSDAGHRFAIYNDQVIERVLLMKFNAENSVNSATIEHVHGEIERVQSLKLVKTGQQFLNQSNTAACNPPQRGSDTATVYDPNRDCNGCFVSSCTQNNCYNYGNDVATNTFAQPGRGTGHKWDANTCSDMRSAAERDGLVWAGTTLPTHEPSIGHYVCLLIWPGTNFHWVRLDSQPAGYWSHKPGQTPVRNVDNNGNKITDCSKADLSPWSQFCGYMTSRPSNVTIN